MSFDALIRQRLDSIRQSGLYRELSRPTGLSFIHNDYLALSTHPEILEAGHRALRDFGSGSRGSRLLGGNSAAFEDVEAKIADFFGSPAALFFSSGYLANLAVIQVLGGLVDEIVSDDRNHASLIDAIRLSGRPKKIVPHARWNELTGAREQNRRLLVTESLFSMDGDPVDAETILPVWQRTDSFLVVDEAHAAGVFPENGRGLVAPSIKEWSRVAVNVTFGKAFGVSGAAVLCSRELKELIVNQGRSFIYTTATSPVVVTMVGTALDVVDKESWRRVELWQRAEKVREILNAVNKPPVGKGSTSAWINRSPIIPFFVTGEDRALRFCQNMRESGLELRAIRYPTVSRGSERVRVSLNLGVSRENTEFMARELVRRWMEFSSRVPIPE